MGFRIIEKYYTNLLLYADFIIMVYLNLPFILIYPIHWLNMYYTLATPSFCCQGLQQML